MNSIMSVNLASGSTPDMELAPLSTPTGLALKPLSNIRKRRIVVQAGPNSKKAKTTLDQYEGIIRSDAEYQHHLYSSWWDHDIIFSGPNEAHVLASNPTSTNFGSGTRWNLDGDLRDGNDHIAPVFAREHWLLEGFVNNPNLVWARMESSLRMASLFLNVPQVAWAFLPLIFGKHSAWNGSQFLSFDRYDGRSELTPEASKSLVEKLKLVGQHFDALAGKVKFTFATFGQVNRWPTGEVAFDLPHTGGWDDKPGAQVHGLHHGPGEQYLSEMYVRGDPAELQACQNAHRIILTGAYAEWLQYDESRMTPTQIARTLFTFGMTLVHEMAHALYCEETHPEICKEGKYSPYDEPHMFTDMSEPEIGSAIERRLVGHAWQAIVHPEQGVAMEAVQIPCVWDEGEPVVGKAHSVNFIEPAWCYEYLTKAKWAQICNIPLEDSESCSYWPPFRVHMRPTEPSINVWWEKRQAGKKSTEMQRFNRKTQADEWEFVYGIENRNVDGTWDSDIGRYDEAVLLVVTLDHEFLKWKVSEARKARAVESLKTTKGSSKQIVVASKSFGAPGHVEEPCRIKKRSRTTPEGSDRSGEHQARIQKEYPFRLAKENVKEELSKPTKPTGGKTFNCIGPCRRGGLTANRPHPHRNGYICSACFKLKRQRIREDEALREEMEETEKEMEEVEKEMEETVQAVEEAKSPSAPHVTAKAYWNAAEVALGNILYAPRVRRRRYDELPPDEYNETDYDIL